MDFFKLYSIRLRAMATAAILCLPVPHAVAQQHAHTHGLLQLDIAVDPQSITLQFESPLDNFLGFEHAPHTDAERKKVADMVTSLTAADGLFQIDPAAGCRASTVQLSSAALGLGHDKEKESSVHAYKNKNEHGADEHADIDATIVFACTNAGAARFITFKLFENYSHLHTLNAQVASQKGQFKRTVKADSPKLDLRR